MVAGGFEHVEEGNGKFNMKQGIPTPETWRHTPHLNFRHPPTVTQFSVHVNLLVSISLVDRGLLCRKFNALMMLLYQNYHKSSECFLACDMIFPLSKTDMSSSFYTYTFVYTHITY